MAADPQQTAAAPQNTKAPQSVPVANVAVSELPDAPVPQPQKLDLTVHQNIDPPVALTPQDHLKESMRNALNKYNALNLQADMLSLEEPIASTSYTSQTALALNTTTPGSAPSTTSATTISPAKPFAIIDAGARLTAGVDGGVGMVSNSRPGRNVGAGIRAYEHVDFKLGEHFTDSLSAKEHAGVAVFKTPVFQIEDGKKIRSEEPRNFTIQPDIGLDVRNDFAHPIKHLTKAVGPKELGIKVGPTSVDAVANFKDNNLEKGEALGFHAHVLSGLDNAVDVSVGYTPNKLSHTELSKTGWTAPKGVTVDAHVNDFSKIKHFIGKMFHPHKDQERG